jgi:hypothetical protein
MLQGVSLPKSSHASDQLLAPDPGAHFSPSILEFPFWHGIAFWSEIKWILLIVYRSFKLPRKGLLE